MRRHKFRRALGNLPRAPLRGGVEGAETWGGGAPAGVQGRRQLRGRHAARVRVAVEKRGRASGRCRRAVLPDCNRATLTSCLQQTLAPGTTGYTAGLKRFRGLHDAGCKHRARSQPRRTKMRTGTTSVVPVADRAMGTLQQWLLGTHHGVRREQRQVYLDECVFRDTRRQQPMAAFQPLLGLGTGRAPTTYARRQGGKDLPQLLSER